MKKELREKVIAHNKRVSEQKDKATDADILIGALLKMPHGQLKKILDDDSVIAVLKKYGYDADGGEVK
jgi:hypothetical protein